MPKISSILKPGLLVPTPVHSIPPGSAPTLDTGDTDEGQERSKAGSKKEGRIRKGEKKEGSNARENTRVNGESLRNLVFKWI